MSIRELLRRTFAGLSRGRVRSAELSENKSAKRAASDETASEGSTSDEEAWLAACEAGLLNPCRDVHDPQGWDNYWRQHLKVGLLEQGFSDVMSSSPALPGLLNARGVRSVLCAGNGFSAEAMSLALLGFNVTSFDISSVPKEMFDRMMDDPENPLRRIAGFRQRDDGSASFDTPGPIDAQFPIMHRSADQPLMGGGSLSFVTGDLSNPEVCPGPFDAVIERRCLQLFEASDQIKAIERLVARLRDPGTLVSHQHRGAWRPGDEQVHYAEALVRSHGFVLSSDSGGKEAGSDGRLAWLVSSSG